MNVGDLVAIQWVDSVGCPRGWGRMDEIDAPGIATVQSVGWLVARSKEKVVLAPHLAYQADGEDIRDASAQGMVTIPRRCIVKAEVVTISF